MDGLELVIVKNPFDRSSREVRHAEHKQQSIQTLILEQLPLGIEYNVAINGQLIEQSSWGVIYPCAGDQLVVTTAIHGGGGGKNILRTVLMIVVMVIATLTQQHYITAGLVAEGGWGATAIFSGIMVVGGMLVNAIVPPIQPKLAGAEDFESSPSYSWNPHLTQQQGRVIPKWYGTCRAYSGNIIASHLESVGEDQYVNALISYGLGPIASLEDVYLNDQPLANYDSAGLGIHERRGWIDQEVVPNFNDTKIEDVRNLTISSVATETYTSGVAGTDFDSLEFEFECPQGLWYANDKGGMDSNRVLVSVGMRLTGTSDDLVMVSESILSDAYYWPGDSHWEYGYWVEAVENEHDGFSFSHTGWNRKGDGSINIEDHVNGAIYASSTKYIWLWIDTGRNIADTIESYIVLQSDKTSPLRRVLKVPSQMFTTGESYDFVITKITTDRDDSKYGDLVKLAIVREIEESDFEYPRSVLFGLRALATDQLSGSLKISLLGNWAIVNTYNGTDWVLQHSRNPAWICYDILSQPVISGNSLATYAIERYDGIDPSRLDYIKFLEWADYCDELVVGMSGDEPRSRFDGGFDLETSMWEAALQVCEVGRAMLLWNGTSISVHIDKPSSPVQLFSMGNILKDSFSEKFLNQTDRISEIEIDFTNVDNEYQRDKINIINPEITNTSNKTSLSLKGVTRYSEAYRLAMLKLNYNQVIPRVLSWSASIDALACQIGDVVYLQHDVPEWGTGGRIISNEIDNNIVVLDQQVTIAEGVTYVLTIRHYDDSVVQYSVLNGTEVTDTLLVNSNITVDSALCSYAFGELNHDKKPVRIISMSRGQDQDINLTAIDYNDSVYNVDTNTPVIDTFNYSNIDLAAQVRNLAIEENLILVHGVVNTQLVVSWQNDEKVKECEVWESSTAGGSAIFVGKYLDMYTNNNAVDEVTYTYFIVPINQFNKKALVANAEESIDDSWYTAAYLSHLTVGKTAEPEDATWQDPVIEKFGIRLSWDANTELDFAHFKLSYGATYLSSILLTELSSTDWLWEIREAGDYTLWLVAVDSGGRESVNPASKVVTINEPASVGLSNSIIGENILFEWAVSEGDFAIEHYELRRDNLVWDDATPVAKIKGTTYSQKIVCTGQHDWLLRAVDVAGNRSEVSYDSVTIIDPGVVGNFTPQVIDNYVLLRFVAPTIGTLPISHYEFRKGDIFSSASVIGTTDGTFNTIFETKAGTYTYWVSAVDSAGNQGIELSLTTTVNQPPDYFLNKDWDSTFSGTKTNCLIRENGNLLVPIDTTETWADHFNVNNSFATIQAQLDAGYPIYAQPTQLSASYVEEFNYGADLAATKITASYDSITHVAGLVITPTIEVAKSDAYPSFTTLTTDAWEVYATDFQYVRLTLDFTGTDTELIELTGLNLTLDSKLKNDSGSGTTTASGGTTMTFIVDYFIDIVSIVVSPAYNASYPVTAVYDFTDIPYPSSFDVYLFRTDTGAQVAGDFSWTAKGY